MRTHGIGHILKSTFSLACQREVFRIKMLFFVILQNINETNVLMISIGNMKTISFNNIFTGYQKMLRFKFKHFSFSET